MDWDECARGDLRQPSGAAATGSLVRRWPSGGAGECAGGDVPAIPLSCFSYTGFGMPVALLQWRRLWFAAPFALVSAFIRASPSFCSGIIALPQLCFRIRRGAWRPLHRAVHPGLLGQAVHQVYRPCSVLPAGAGLVRGSIAERELQEVSQKLAVLADQLDLHSGSRERTQTPLHR